MASQAPDTSNARPATAKARLANVERPRRRLSLAQLVRLYPQLIVGIVVLTLLTLSAVFAPVITPYGPAERDPAARLAGPSAQHWFGTDLLGRDLFSRIIHGGRLSLTVAASSVALGMVAGVTLGLVSGYVMGTLDSLIMRIVDGMIAFPNLVLALAIAFVLGPSRWTITLALGIVSVPSFARLVRAQMLVLRNQEFIHAAEAIGARPLRVVLHHYLPNLVSIILILASLSAGQVIFAEASLGFLGLGVPPPAPSWGGMLRDGYVYLEINAWQSITPGLFIFLAILGFNFLGDGLRDVLDPHQRRRRGV